MFKTNRVGKPILTLDFTTNNKKYQGGILCIKIY
jgi:hypothetical protein|nr:MAG TPA: hypothetical protein [Caudoviricetes sp.]